MEQNKLQLQGITKTFPGVRAVDDVTLEFVGGEIHGLVGENGAGKSTLMKVLSGIYRADKGVIVLNGKQLTIHNYRDAVKFGIGLVHQEISVLPDLSICENLYLGSQALRKGFIDWGFMAQEGSRQLGQLGLNVNIWSTAKELTLAQQKIVDIVKVLRGEPMVLILDEPTAPLGPTEVKRLFELLQRLKKQHKIIIFISHRLDEVLEIADRITVMKDGRVVDTIPAEEATRDRIITMMVGRELGDLFPSKAKKDSKEKSAISIKLKLPTWETEIAFTVQQGEIIGIGGLQGQGQHELIQGLFGLAEDITGYIKIKEKKLIPRNARYMKQQGFALVPLDRQRQGLLLKRNVGENLALASLNKRSWWGFIRTKEEQADINKIVKELKIKASSLGQKVVFLSGGNQQKVVFGKWLLTNPKVLLLIEPTLGVDVATKRDIYFRLRELSQDGMVVLIATSDMLELIGLCDRVLIMYEGKVSAELTGEQITEQSIARAAVTVEQE